MANYNVSLDDIDEHGHLIETYPREITGFFACSHSKLTSLKGVPEIIGNSFYCEYANIASLEYGPRIVGMHYFCGDSKIISLEGAAEIVAEDFICAHTKIISLEGIGRRYLKKIGGKIDLYNCPIKSNMLGLILVKGLIEILFNTNEQIQDIFNKHLDADRDVLECQEELRAKGFKEYAKL